VWRASERESGLLESGTGDDDNGESVSGVVSQQDERFRLAMENAAIGMCLVSPDGRFISVNAALCEMLGRDAASLTASTWQELTHPDDLEIDLDLVDDVLAGRISSYRLLKRYLKPDGTLVWGDLCVACVRDDDDTVREFVSQIVDVTGRVASEEHYRLLAENAADVVVRCSGQGILEWVSPSAAALTGWAPEELTGRALAGLVHADDVATVLEAHEAVLAGTPAQITVRLTTRADGQKWTSMTLQPVCDDGDAVVGSVGGWRDVHAEYEARRALEKSEAHFRAVADSAADAIVTADVRGVIHGWNAAAESIFGYSQAEAVGSPVTMLMPERYRAAHPAALRRVREGDERRVMGTVVELEAQRRDGTEFPIDLSMAEWTVGEECFVTTIIRDATQRREAAAEIERLNADLERRIAERTYELSLANAELEELVYAIAHDLRTPLRSLAGFSEIISADYRDAVDETGKDYLGRIHAAASHMGEVMDSLLALSRVSRGPLDVSDVDLSDLARELVGRLRRTEPERAVEFDTEDGLVAEADAALCKVLLGNLLGNAWKFTAGEVPAHISFRTVDVGGRCVLCVSDDGVGFDQRYTDRLFRPFERLHAQEDFDGTGIGLATVRRIVRRFGGDCWATGAVGEGASFFFTLPTTGADPGGHR